MSGVKRLNLDWQTCFIKILAFKTNKFVRRSELIRNDPGLADRLIVAFMRVAIHPEDRLVGLNDLHHVQGIERRSERAALVFGVGLDDRGWLITTRGPFRFLPNQFSNFDAKFLCSAIESAGVKGVSSGL